MIPLNPVYADGCIINPPSLDGINGSSSDECSTILSVTSGPPGANVTLTALNFFLIPAGGHSAVHRNLPMKGPEYFIYFQPASGKVSNDVFVASGNLTCNILMHCTEDSPAAIFMETGSFLSTFVVPQISPGVYNIVVTVAYTPSMGTHYDESAATMFTVT
jgi:hypothetical protein